MRTDKQLTALLVYLVVEIQFFYNILIIREKKILQVSKYESLNYLVFSRII